MKRWRPGRSTTSEALAIDVDALARIHGRSFPHAWSADEFAGFLREPNVVCLVVRLHPWFGRTNVQGFILLRLAADEAEVLTVAVDPSYRGRGVGRTLLEEAMRRLYREGTARLFLEVEDGNQPALQLYRSMGFEEVGKRQRYYERRGAGTAGALVMRAQLR